MKPRKPISDETREKMRQAALNRSPEAEANRLKGLRSPEARERIRTGLAGKKPKNFEAMQAKGWEASRKELLSYPGIHAWVKRNWGKANCCEECGKENLAGQRVHWANLDHQYSRNREDWKMLCRPCHAAYDSENLGVSFERHQKTVSGETREKIAAASRGRSRTPEQIEKAASKNRGQKRTEEQRERLAAAHRGKPWSAARREAHERRKKLNTDTVES